MGRGIRRRKTGGLLQILAEGSDGRGNLCIPFPVCCRVVCGCGTVRRYDHSRAESGLNSWRSSAQILIDIVSSVADRRADKTSADFTRQAVGLATIA
jgi:hypothetical protein